MFFCEEAPVAANDNNKGCLHCGAHFAFRDGKKFCSRVCKKRYGSRHDVRHRNAPERICAGCGVTFRRKTGTKDAAKYCSRECAFSDNVQGRLASQESRELAVSFRVSYSVYRSVCSLCGVRFAGKNIASNTCDDCRQARYIAANDNGRDRSPRPCVECGTVFAPEYGDKRQTFCSARCSAKSARRIRKPKQRARNRSATVENVDPFKVFDRDDWRCQFCKVKTPRRLRGTYKPNAPELDHIIPLSCGGEHSYRNTQCLCRACNAQKSNNPLGQLRLFG